MLRGAGHLILRSRGQPDRFDPAECHNQFLSHRSQNGFGSFCAEAPRNSLTTAPLRLPAPLCVSTCLRRDLGSIVFAAEFGPRARARWPSLPFRDQIPFSCAASSLRTAVARDSGENGFNRKSTRPGACAKRAVMSTGYRMLSANPSMCILTVSGYPVDMTALSALAPGRVAFLLKPFTPQSLADAVGGLLAAQEKGL